MLYTFGVISKKKNTIVKIQTMSIFKSNNQKKKKNLGLKIIVITRIFAIEKYSQIMQHVLHNIIYLFIKKEDLNCWAHE